ncbi:MAG: class I SAM-dependent methyltransferase [Pseudomonadota bacterium]
MTLKPDRWREMGLQTVTGQRSQGFFVPYRYADQVTEPSRYPALEARFDACRSAMQDTLDEIDRAQGVLQALNGPPPVPRWDQSWFPRLDGAAAYAMCKRFEPRRIIEVGSGHSTRMLAYATAGGAQITCIDPEPRADIAALGTTLHRRVLRESDADLFASLQPGDIAFFDSSHILWPGSDVDMIFNRIFPVLKPGVLIHVHDVLLPDPYPEAWAWRGYTEQNGLTGWLFGGCEIVFSSHYALTRMDAEKRAGVAALPIPDGALETSLWLRRL